MSFLKGLLTILGSNIQLPIPLIFGTVLTLSSFGSLTFLLFLVFYHAHVVFFLGSLEGCTIFFFLSMLVYIGIFLLTYWHTYLSVYLSKHFIFSNLDYILALELFKYILSLEYVLVSGKFARIIHDIWGNALDIEGNQFPLCSFFFFQVHLILQMSLEALVAKVCLCLSGYMKV